MKQPTQPTPNEHPASAADPTTGTERKVVLLTGATRGIGKSIAEDLSGDHDLILAASSEESAEKLRSTYPAAQVFVANLADVESLESALSGLALDRLDALVPCAGVTGHDPVRETTPEQWQRLFRINLFSIAELVRCLLPALHRAQGIVIAINSGAGHFSGKGFGPYAASKFALRALTDSLREEERGRIRVSSIHPGKVDSDMQREIQALRGNEYNAAQFIRPETIARAVRFALETSEESMTEEITIRPVQQ
ncbi:SDR family oxidoreductase [Corynebacterium heidelbergense]|uniref:Short chain dehydrogenase n=1 Tax=Corynebacterium heidelbergense TaxID=2055947 RepID=A0A364V5L8_9CORY|nr:SDR family oxidoreductase [Corynebacterium heidelbergense]RAV31927.1 short chain dehydrogenase [Corynebacterium heidelbergense]